MVLAGQERLRELGYLTTEPDGAYGDDTMIAVRQFQARNDLVVDGYLGPSTRTILMSDSAKPNGMMLGEQGDAVALSLIHIYRLLRRGGGNLPHRYGLK